MATSDMVRASMQRGLSKVSGYHDCPCRDCFEIAIGGALDSDESAPGPIYLQGDHGPVAYRNIVLTPAKSGAR